MQTITIQLALMTLLSSLINLCIKILSESLGSFTQLAMRSMLVAAISFIAIRGSLHWRRIREEAWLYLVRSLLLTLLGGGLFSLATQTCKLGVVAFLSALPFEAVWGAILFRERVTLKELLGYTAALYGVWILCGAGESIDTAHLRGVVLAVLSALFWGLGIALGRYHRPSVSGVELSIVTVALGGIWSTGIAGVSGEMFNFRPSLGDWGVLGLSAVLVSFYSTLLHKLSRLASMSQIAMAGLLQPGLVAILGYVLFGEELSSVELVACGWIVLGVLGFGGIRDV